jgi:UDP-N-acetylmuramoyl-tripeptide--D-alanyl-D-alanine ligase
MISFNPDVMAQWVSAEWENGIPQGTITGISKDTRTLQPGDLYIAIRGEQFDGHAFVGTAFEKGAAGALVCDDFEWTDGPVLKVCDTIEGLQALAAGYRKSWSCTVIGITGSVGKTTVKEMCADVLSMKGKTHRTAGNYNNHIGLPLTMLAMPRDTEFGVFEIGMNHPGEIGPLTDLLKPSIGMITDICNAHREAFDSLEGIAREKAELVAQLPESGVAILDRDSEWFDLMRGCTPAHLVSFSFSGAGDYDGVVHQDGALEVSGICYSMPQPGEHMVRNAIRAVVLGQELGMEPMAVEEGLNLFAAPPMRWQESVVSGIHFINDAYNANPLSMRAALKTFSGMSGAGRKWAVVGGMRELGETADEEHAALGRFIANLKLDGVIIVGELGKQIVCEDIEPVFYCQETADASDVLKNHLQAGDHVLLKASRGERLEQVLKQFKEI